MTLKHSNTEERELPNGVKQTFLFYDDENNISQVEVSIKVNHEKYSVFETRFKELMKMMFKK